VEALLRHYYAQITFPVLKNKKQPMPLPTHLRYMIIYCLKRRGTDLVVSKKRRHD
jgi:hypothetical protein